MELFCLPGPQEELGAELPPGRAGEGGGAHAESGGGGSRARGLLRHTAHREGLARGPGGVRTKLPWYTNFPGEVCCI